MAGKQVQRRRGSTAQEAVFIGALAEVTVDTDKKVTVVHDGVTPGGFPTASARDIAATNATVVTAQARADSAYALAQTGVTNAATADGKAVAAQNKADQAQTEVDALETVVAADKATAVQKDNNTGAAHMPTGNNAQRPVAPQEGDFRYNSQLAVWEGYTSGTWKTIGGGSGGVPLFTPLWMPLRTALPVGYVAADGQTLTRTTYPDATAGILANQVPIATDAVWNSTPTERGKYTAGDGTSTFRIPDYNGKFSGSLGAVFMRGDGALSAGTDGVLQPSANLSHNHAITDPGHAHSMGVTTGTAYTAGGVFSAIAGSGGTAAAVTGISVQASGGTEAHPLSVTGCWAIKLS